MINNKYIVLSSLHDKNGGGGLVVLSSAGNNTKINVSVFGVKDSEFEVLVDDLVFVRQYSLSKNMGQFVLEKNIEDLTDVVVGVFNKNRELVLVGSTIGVETKKELNRLEIALEQKYSLNHFGDLARQVVNNQNSTFLDDIIFLLFDLFACGVPDKSLESLIPFSRWVKVYCEKDVIAVGIVEKNGKVASVGLAFPVICKQQTRAEIDSNFNFIPLNTNNPNGFGYYVILQSAKDGKVVSIKA